jgi:ABC-2 type transport system ATP-binding protein
VHIIKIVSGGVVIVEIEGLQKIYDGKQRVVAVDGIDLNVREGELFGLLGPNGAGKTTTISICTTRALPTSGRVRIAGVDVVAAPAIARRSIGVVPQYNTLDRACTIFENIHFHCLYFGFSRPEAKQRTDQLLAQFHLTERAGSYPSQLSGGLAQRVQIARAIAHRPKVLFLDEPSAGLDPQSRIAMWDAVRGLRKEGITVVLTTHYMEEADELCDRVAIIDHGKILVQDTPTALKGSVGAQRVYELYLRSQENIPALIQQLQQLPGVASAESTPKGARILAHGAEGLLSDVVREADPYGLRDLTITETSLETVFIHLTGRDLRE